MSVLKHVGFFLLPVSAAALGAAWHLDMLPRLAIKPALETSQAKVEFARTVTSNFESLRYPNEPQLMPLQREWLTAESPRDVDSFASEEYANNMLVPGEQALLASSERRVKTSPTINSDDDLGLSLGDLDLSSLSPDLALKVERALANNDQPLPSQASRVGDLEREAKQWFGRLPALNLQTHMYASDAKRRWVKINNVEYHQGDVVEGQVTLKEILPQAVIVEFQGEQIRIPALYEWQG